MNWKIQVQSLFHHSQRHPWLAGLASLLVPGLGQLYAGYQRRAVVFFLIIFIYRISWSSVVLNWAGSKILAIVALITLLDFALGVWVMIDAYLLAKENRPPHLPWQRWYVYLLILSGWMGLAANGDFLLIETRNIPSSSMAPTLLVGDYVLVDKRIRCLDCPQSIHRGDILVFYRTDPKKDDTAYIKRVIGLPGDEVEIRENRVIINGEPLDYRADPNPETLPPLLQSQLSQPELILETIHSKEHHVLWDQVAKARDLKTNIKVPEGHLYMLGDNRHHSYDSRFYGTVPLQWVVGKARSIYFHRSPDKTHFWYRVGIEL